MSNPKAKDPVNDLSELLRDACLIDKDNVQEITIGEKTFYAVKKIHVKDVSIVAPVSDAPEPMKREDPPKTEMLGEYMIAGPTNSLAELHDLDSNTNPSSSHMMTVMGPASSTNIQLQDLHNVPSSSYSNSDDPIFYHDPPAEFMQFKDVLIAQNSLVNNQYGEFPFDGSHDDLAAIVQDLIDSEPANKKRKRHYSNKDEELIDNVAGSVPEELDIHFSQNANQLDYQQDYQQHADVYYELVETPTIPIEVVQPETPSTEVDCDLDLEALKDSFIKKDQFGELDETQRFERAKILIENGKVKAVRKRANLVNDPNRSFKCVFCPIMKIDAHERTFNNNEDLYRHHCQHFEHKPINCANCCEGFYRKDHLKRHMKNAHGQDIQTRSRAPNNTSQISPK